MKLHGARVLLTGASRGIGREVARRLAGRGARLVLGRDPAAVAAVCNEIFALGGRADSIVFDLAASAGHDTVVGRARVILGGIDVLVNNAGVSSFDALERQSAEAIARIAATNLVAPMLLARAALPHLAAGARIVNVGSMFGSIGFPHYAAYSATKFGLRGFSEALRREVAERGIGVTYVAPRAARTGANSAALYRFAARTGMTMDAPGDVAEGIVGAIERDEAERFFGGPEPFFARLNALLPRLVDRALGKQARIGREVLRDDGAAPSAQPLKAAPAD
jgi:NAD(P)-dependent dehydrogenase (short-subunit alcohol dehydrogenase family)